MTVSILVVDDEAIQREMLAGYLAKRGHTVANADSGPAALAMVENASFDILITDQKMPGMSGIELAERVHNDHPNISVIVLTAFGSVENAVQAMKNGVEDYLTKPVNLEELDLVIARIVEKRHLVAENRRLREQVSRAPRMPGIIAASAAMEEVMSKAARAAETAATVLITGESGTGKEVVARAIHQVSDRRDRPFVAVNCAACPENLIESELFGHEKGSFTGADRRRIGRFEQADGGTLFLDEIGEIPPSVQIRLLRVLQERSFERVGGNETVQVQVRIIAATNRSLEDAVESGAFRRDLYYRLHVVSIDIPPLRNRRADIPVLLDHFVAFFSREHVKPVTGLTPEALDLLVKYSFPGNVRELANIIEQAVVLCRDTVIGRGDLPPQIADAVSAVGGDDGGLDAQVAALEKTALVTAMRQSRGNKSAAARQLGISERKIRYLLNKYGLEEE